MAPRSASMLSMNAEQGALLRSVGAALLMGMLGVSFALVTNSRAILLDGLFNLTYFAVALVTVRVAGLAVQPDSSEFPFGYAYFESLINAGKGVLILGISAAALIDSLQALFSGGRSVAAEPAIFYAVLATALCSLTAWWLQRRRREVDSPLLHADVQNWVLDALISGTVLLAFCLVPVFQTLGWPEAVPYIDPVLVAAVVIICLGVPVRMAKQAMLELLNRAPPAWLSEPVTVAIDRVLQRLPVRSRYVRMVRPGRTLYVVVHTVLAEDFPVERLATLDQLREELATAIRAVHPRVVVDAMFTAEERWAAPTSGLHEPIAATCQRRTSAGRF